MRCCWSVAASSCCATRSRGSGGGVTGSTQPRPQSSRRTAARSRVSLPVARNRQLRVVPERLSVRPMRWRNDATVRGESIWMTRSRSLTSMQFQCGGGDDDTVSCLCEGLFRPGSFVGRERGVREEHRHFARPQGGSQLLHLSSGLAGHQPLLSSVQGGDQLGRVVERPYVVQLHLAWRPEVPGREGDGRGCSRGAGEVGGYETPRRLPAPDPSWSTRHGPSSSRTWCTQPWATWPWSLVRITAMHWAAATRSRSRSRPIGFPTV